MDNNEEVKEPKTELPDLSELEKKVTALEEKRKIREKNKEPDDYLKKYKELSDRLNALNQDEEANRIFENAISKEQEWDNLSRRVGTREERIKALELDTKEKLKDLQNLLATDNYQQYFFSSLNNDPEDEKLRRFCFHANRMSPDEFIEKYKQFVLQNKFRVK